MNWRNGLNGLALNGVLGYLTVDAVLDQHYVDAALWGGIVFSRYYRGNIFRAEEAVKRFNLRQSRREHLNHFCSDCMKLLTASKKRSSTIPKMSVWRTRRLLTMA